MWYNSRYEERFKMSGEKQSALPDGFAVENFDRNDDFIKSRILTIRGVQIVLDRDLAELYGVQTKVLNQAVKRNANRFPPEFMFALAKDETEELVTNCDRFRSVRHSSVAKTPITPTAIEKFNKQNPTLKVKAVGTFHDRFLILDGKELYHFGASLKDLGRQYCAVSKMDAMFIPSILERI